MKKLEIKLRHFEELEAIMDRERESVSGGGRESCVSGGWGEGRVVRVVEGVGELCEWWRGRGSCVSGGGRGGVV